jgi:superfamily II DNA/RNA helicase
MEDFLQFNLPTFLQSALDKLGYAKPTIIQQKAIPIVLEGKDVLATAQTGTGKTGAFLIPLLTYLTNNPSATALILSPTRELSQQIYGVALSMITANKALKASLLIGGESIHKQIFQLKNNPRLIIGTPGRVTDHINRGNLNLDQTSFVVLDETDKMMDMGFGVQIDEIFKYLPEKRQIVLFSATLPKSILKIANNYLKNPIRVESGEVNTVSVNITQKTIETKNKHLELVNFLEAHKGAVIIFVKTQQKTFEIATKLRDLEYKVNFIHGGLKQNNRNNVIKSFRDKKFDILVATDVASRGLDIPHIEYVINYDLPENPEDYVHRIGRVGRGDKTGEAISLLSDGDKYLWRNIQKFLNAEEVDESYKQQYNKKSSGRGNSRGGFGGGSRDGNSRGGFGGGSRDGNSRGGFGGGSRDGNSRGGFGGGSRDGNSRGGFGGGSRDGNSRGGFGGASRDGGSRDGNSAGNRSDGNFESPRNFNRDDSQQAPRRSNYNPQDNFNDRGRNEGFRDENSNEKPKRSFFSNNNEGNSKDRDNNTSSFKKRLFDKGDKNDNREEAKPKGFFQSKRESLFKSKD